MPVCLSYLLICYHFIGEGGLLAPCFTLKLKHFICAFGNKAGYEEGHRR